jgi:polyphosphate glucokinase
LICCVKARLHLRALHNERWAGMTDTHTLAIDIGGTGLKATVLNSKGKMLVDRVRVPTPYPLTPAIFLDTVETMVAALPPFDRISAGYPGFVKAGVIITSPHFGETWANYPLADALTRRFGKPARVINDAEVQGFGAMQGKGLELVITLGTGLGTAIFNDGKLMPHMEFAHFPVRSKTEFNDYVGNAALKKIGVKKWASRVQKTIKLFTDLMHYDQLYIGGGNAAKLTPEQAGDAKLVANEMGLTGGIRLWDDYGDDKPAAPAKKAVPAKKAAPAKKIAANGAAKPAAKKPAATRKPAAPRKATAAKPA